MKGSEFGALPPVAAGQWLFGRGEKFHWIGFRTETEAVAEGRAWYSDGEAFQVGQAAELSLAAPDADDAISRMADSAWDQVGEGADDFLSQVPKEASDELTAALRQTVGEWMTRHGLWPDVCKVVSVKDIPAERQS